MLIMVIIMALLMTLAIILSIDAFSIAISLGINDSRHYRYLLFSLMVGIFHFVMPVLGTLTNKLIISKLIVNGNRFLGIILIIIAIQIIIDINGEKSKEIKSNSLILLSLAVSIDSYFTGMGLKSINVNTLNYLLFSLVSFLFSYVGCYIGNKTKKIFNKYAYYISVLILLVLGVKFLLYN